jgi:exonuclease SbcC
MIKTAEIRYYQSHKGTKIRPSSGLTVITGTSHHGKSALLRGVKWPLLNRPIGFDFKSWFADHKDITRSAIQFDDGHIIREKSKYKDTNQYKVSGMDEPLVALGTDLPDEVTRVTRMSSINIQSQHDPYFMLQNSPGEVGRMFNEAVGLQIIDESLKDINKVVTRTLNHYNYKKDENDKLEHELESYEYLDQVKPLLSEAEDLLEQLHSKNKRRYHLARVVKGMEELELQKFRAEQVLKHEDDWVIANNLLATLILKKNRLLQLEEIVDDIWESKERLAEINEVMEQEEELEWCISKLDEMQEKASIAFKLQEKVTLLEMNKMRRTELSDKMAVISAEYSLILKTIERCPTCLSPITDEQCEHILKEGL